MNELDRVLRRDCGLKTGIEMPVNDWLSTGNIALDWAASSRYINGGLPVGRVVEIFGDPSTGKSLLLMSILAQGQKKNGIVILDDTEGAYNEHFAKTIGLDTSKLYMVDPASRTVEEHFVQVEEMICKIREVDEKVLVVIALDSLANLSTTHEQEEGFKKVDMTRAKLIRQGMRSLGVKFNKENILYIVTNHVIASIGGYISSKVTPGGSGIPFQASVRIELTSKGIIEGENEKVIGINVRVKIKKNKVSVPFKEVQLQIFFDKGIEKNSGVIDALVTDGVLKSTDGWYEWENKKYREKGIKEHIDKILASLQEEKKLS